MQKTISARHKSVSLTNLPWLILGLQAGLLVVMLIAGLLGFGAILFYNTGHILPGVSSYGVRLGGMSIDAGAAALRTAWLDQELVLNDAGRRWHVMPSALGLTLDAAATALDAQQVGRGAEGIAEAISSLFRGREVPPVITVDLAQARIGLESLAERVNIPARNASIRIEGGEVRHMDAFPGRELDIETLLSALALPEGAGAALFGDTLDLPMIETLPTITDARPVMAAAQAMLGQTFNIHAYDPYIDQTFFWTIEPAILESWLSAGHGADGQSVVLALDEDSLTAYLQSAVASLDADRTLDIAESIAIIQETIAAGQLTATVRIRSLPVQYTVQHGDTFMQIARKFGIPVLYLTQANPTLDPRSLHAGNVVNIPSRETMLPLPLVYGKRIVVDISDLRLLVYEQGALIQNWGTSTGIDESPTLPGVFQIRSHELNAYASNWDLYMPHFMGVYEAAPGFMNGIHGLPTRGGQTLVWRDALGSYRASYGCIILGLEEAAWLFDWAEEGVVVEIRE